jgi:hypothetical protein
MSTSWCTRPPVNSALNIVWHALPHLVGVIEPGSDRGMPSSGKSAVGSISAYARELSSLRTSRAAIAVARLAAGSHSCRSTSAWEGATSRL